MSNRTLVSATLIVFLACFFHPAWSQESTTLRKIRIGMPNRAVPNLALPAAQRYGFFRKHGLDAELIVMRPSISLQTLLAGELDFSTVLSSAARASVSGVPLRIVKENKGEFMKLLDKGIRRPGSGGGRAGP
jgi:ABC-type nitrate/sulfonate/bicarbonate transport system substrate-binding protein